MRIRLVSCAAFLVAALALTAPRSLAMEAKPGPVIDDRGVTVLDFRPQSSVWLVCRILRLMPGWRSA